MARRMTSETLISSSAARSRRSRLSSGSSRTDSTEAAAEPIGGRPTTTSPQDFLDVGAVFGLVRHQLDHLVGDRSARSRSPGGHTTWSGTSWHRPSKTRPATTRPSWMRCGARLPTPGTALVLRPICATVPPRPRSTASRRCSPRMDTNHASRTTRSCSRTARLTRSLATTPHSSAACTSISLPPCSRSEGTPTYRPGSSRHPIGAA